VRFVVDPTRILTHDDPDVGFATPMTLFDNALRAAVKKQVVRARSCFEGTR
jgi:hypothetical protein